MDKNEEKFCDLWFRCFSMKRTTSAFGHKTMFLLSLKDYLGVKDYKLPMKLVLGYDRKRRLISCLGIWLLERCY